MPRNVSIRTREPAAASLRRRRDTVASMAFPVTSASKS